ncbi:MAG: hypothetical protein WB660_16620 [Candidatus Sulfotelmatobacter sp.]
MCDPKHPNQREAANYSRNIDDTYIFDSTTGIYKPKTAETGEQRNHHQAGTNRRTPFFTKPWTDWRPVIVSVVISLGTLALLGFTVHYSRQQYQEMKRSADAAMNTVCEMRKQTANSITAMKLDERAWVGLSYPEIKPMQPDAIKLNGQTGSDLSIPIFKNTGRTPARNVSVVFGNVWTRDNPVDLFIKDDKWMKKILDKTKSGFLKGITSIENRPGGREGQLLEDPSFFPPHSSINSGLQIPEIRPIGALPPDIPFSLPIAYMFNNPTTPALGSFILYGRVTYDDIWGEPHETVFCTLNRHISMKGIFEACPTFNDME